MINLPKGCRFRPRCDFATEICGELLPALREIGENSEHFAACHHSEDLDLQTLTIGDVRGVEEVAS